jgi:hypothetical protein
MSEVTGGAAAMAPLCVVVLAGRAAGLRSIASLTQAHRVES